MNEQKNEQRNEQSNEQINECMNIEPDERMGEGIRNTWGKAVENNGESCIYLCPYLYNRTIHNAFFWLSWLPLLLLLHKSLTQLLC